MSWKRAANNKVQTAGCGGSDHHRTTVPPAPPTSLPRVCGCVQHCRSDPGLFREFWFWWFFVSRSSSFIRGWSCEVQTATRSSQPELLLLQPGSLSAVSWGTRSSEQWTPSTSLCYNLSSLLSEHVTKEWVTWFGQKPKLASSIKFSYGKLMLFVSQNLLCHQSLKSFWGEKKPFSLFKEVFMDILVHL